MKNTVLLESLVAALHEWKFGVPRDVLVLHSNEIAEFLRANKIKPFAEQQISHNVEMKSELRKPQPDPWMIYGGIKVPHLHYNGQVFMLNEKQWKEFSGSMLTKVKDKLAHTNEVSFEQLMELSSVVGKLP